MQTIEPIIANFITQHDNEALTFEQIVERFKDTYYHAEENKRGPAINMFGILYAKQIEQLNLPFSGPKSIVENAVKNAGSANDDLHRGVIIGTELRNHIIRTALHESQSSSNDYNRYLRALRTKPFLLLAGISGTGKSRVVRELAFKSCPVSLQDADGTTPGNYLMVEVKPNWHDSTELRGYYSNIAKGYQPTDFILFAAKAAENPDVPFFVCLDEMNLAPVEQYFAEFLSVLETRKKIGDHIISGELLSASDMDNLKAQEKLKDVDVLKNWPSRKALTLPDNLFVIGTVNMDDTTHQFSRKVIDRAMTIEMNGGDLSDMFGRSHDLEYLPASDVWGLNSFAPEYVTADEALDKHPAEAEQMKKELTERLQAINSVLENTPFQVSYRVLNELCIYTAVLLDDGFAIDEAIDEAVDQIALMKILPRIEGDEDMFSFGNGSENKLGKLMELFGPDSDSWKKLDEMNKRLGNGGGFTRFWP